MSVAEQPAQRPEGRLLADALKRDGRSANKAAEEAGISGTRWRHIVNGYQPVGRGQFVEVVGPASTLARMARTLDVTAAELEAAGRADAAEELRSIVAGESHFSDFIAENRRRTWVQDRLVAIGRELTELAAELARIDGGGPVTPPPWESELHRLAAYRTDTPSARERFDAAQDEAAEAPDAPGSEHGA